MSKSKAIAFFPWVYIDEPITIGPLRMIPYERGNLPGNLPHASQADIDAILGAYQLRRGKLLDTATLLEFGDWETGQPADDHLRKLFLSRDLIAFSALSARRLFEGHSGYANTDNYRVVVQRYHEGEGDTFAFSTRRRDGGTQQIWSSDEFSYQCPLHVYYSRLDIDIPLLKTLILADKLPSHFSEAIVEFNNSNTDAAEVQVHAEVVMAKSAFEWLYKIDSDARDLVLSVHDRLSQFELISQIPPGPLKDRWRQRWPTYALTEAWVRDFCRLRGAAAHGKDKSKGAPVWSAERHLAFVAIMFPLLFKVELQRTLHFQMDQRDIERLRQFESYLSYDPFDPASFEQGVRHPWGQLDSRARMRASAKAAYQRAVTALKGESA